MKSLPPGRVDAAFVVLAMLVLVAVAAPRLPQAPLEGHSWRQSLTASVVRGYRCGAPFLEPRVDACGDGPSAGVQAMEFPAEAWLMAVVGGVAGPHVGERLVALLGGLFALAGLALVARREAGPGAVGAGALAAIGAVSSGLFLFYAVTLIPDVAADGLALVGAAWALSGSRPRLVGGSLLMSLGIATKLVALPVLALTATALFLALLRDRDAPRFSDLVLHVVLVGSLPLVWYLGWNPHLAKTGACQLFWMKLDEPLRSVTLSLPLQVHARLGDLVGPAGRAGTWLALVVLLALRRGAALPVVALWVASSLLWAMLGWHHDAHEYDTLLLLAPATLTLGAALGATAATLKPGAAVTLAVAVTLLAGAPGVFRAVRQLPARETVETPVLALLARSLDRLLPEHEALAVPDAGADPRVSYFTARPTWNDALDCDHPPAGCALSLAPRAVACNRPASAVYLPDATLTCGLQGGSFDAVRARLAGSFGPAAAKDVPGLGRLLGFDAAHRDGAPARVDLWFEATRETGAMPAITGGRVERAAGPFPEGALFVVRVMLDAPGPFRVGVGDLTLRGTTEDAGAPENRCAR